MQMITQTYIPSFIEILTPDGWLEIQDFNPKASVLVISPNFKTCYLKPKEFSNYNYQGTLMEIETDSCLIYIKPSVKVLTNDCPKKAKELIRGDLLNRFNMWSKIDNVTQGQWEGRLFSLFFGEELYLPIKFDNDYCLILV